MIVGGTELVVGRPLLATHHSALVLSIGATTALGLSVGALVTARRNPRWMEFRITYRGDDVRLFGTRDKVEFGQVRRALIRAVEANRDLLP
jgi:hypothetical protein